MAAPSVSSSASGSAPASNAPRLWIEVSVVSSAVSAGTPTLTTATWPFGRARSDSPVSSWIVQLVVSGAAVLRICVNVSTPIAPGLITVSVAAAVLA